MDRLRCLVKRALFLVLFVLLSEHKRMLALEGEQEIGKIKNPLDDFYYPKRGTIHANSGSIVPLERKYLKK